MGFIPEADMVIRIVGTSDQLSDFFLGTSAGRGMGTWRHRASIWRLLDGGCWSTGLGDAYSHLTEVDFAGYDLENSEPRPPFSVHFFYDLGIVSWIQEEY